MNSIYFFIQINNGIIQYNLQQKKIKIMKQHLLLSVEDKE